MALFYRSNQPGKLDGEQPDQVTREPRFCCSASFVARGEAGNCSTVTFRPALPQACSLVCSGGRAAWPWEKAHQRGPLSVVTQLLPALFEVCRLRDNPDHHFHQQDGSGEPRSV